MQLCCFIAKIGATLVPVWASWHLTCTSTGMSESQARIQPHPLDHVGLAVPDIEKAVNFYRAVFGFQVIMGPAEEKVDDSTMGKMLNDVFEGKARRLKLCHMVTANGAGLELFEYVEPETEPRHEPFPAFREGLFHFNTVDPDLRGLAERVERHGGKRRTDFHKWDSDLPFEMVYLEDPFGNIIEGYSHPYGVIYAALAAKQKAESNS